MYLSEIESTGHSWRIKPALSSNGCIYFCRPGSFRFLRFENSACWIHHALHVMALANSVCLLALSHSNLYLPSRFLRTDYAVLCAVLAVLQYSRCSLFACLRCRTLVTYLLCGFVWANCCAVLCCACFRYCNTSRKYDARQHARSRHKKGP